MKTLFHHITSVLLALLVLLSTISWTVDKHLCMGRVMDISFFAQADDCCMEMAMKQISDLENKCCDDESFTYTGQDDLKLSWNDLDLDHQIFLLSFTSSYFDLFAPVEQRTSFNETHPPPNLVEDICILNQTFLI